MPIFIDVMTRLSRAEAVAAAREAEAIFGRAGRAISDDFGRATGSLFDGILGRADRASRELEGLQRTYSATADAEAAAASRMERSRRQSEIAETRLAEVREKHGDLSSKAMTAELALADARARSGRDARGYVDALNDTEIAHRAVTDATVKSAESVGMFGGAFAGMSGTALAVGGVTAAVAGLGVAIAKSVPPAADFQAELMKLHTAADIPVDKLQSIQNMVLSMAPQVGIDPGELMNGAYFAAKAGHRNATDMGAVLKAGAQMAAIEDVPLETALSAITTQISDYHLKASDAASVGSQIVTGAGAAKVPLGEFAGAMHVVEPVASSMGIGAPQWMAMVAQMTQSGMHADNAGQDVLSLIQKIQAPTNQMRAEWGALGLDPTQIKTQFSADPLSTIQKLADAISAHTDQNGMVNIDANYKNVQVQQSMQQMLASMNTDQRKVAEHIQSGDLTFKQYRKSRGDASEDDVKKIEQFNTLFQQSRGFSQLLSSGQGSQQTRQQAIQALIGDQVSGQAFQQLTGEANARAQSTAASIAGSKPDASGNVEGSAEALNTYQGNVKKLSAAWDSLKVSMGTAFLPTVTSGLEKLNTAMNWIVQHRAGIGSFFHEFETVALGGAHAVEGLWHAVDGAWHAIDTFGHGVGRVIGQAKADFEKLKDAHPFQAIKDGVDGLLHSLGDIPGAVSKAAGALGHMAADGFGKAEHLLHIPGHANGGPIAGDGPDGVDSELSLLAPGEHVWTAGEVNAVGGQNAMFRLRAAARAGQLTGYSTGGSRRAPGPGEGGIMLTDPNAPQGPAGTRNDPVFIKSSDENESSAHRRHRSSNRGDDATPGPGNDGLGGAQRHNGRADMPDMDFGAEMDDAFGLKDGLPGFAKWVVTFLGNMAIAPMEGAMLGSLLKPPNGQDTQLSWLQPGEFVQPKSAVNAVGMDGMNRLRNAKHYDTGGPVDESGQPTAPGQPMGSSGGGKPGLGISGGALGAAEGAAAMAASMSPAGPAGGMAVQALSQMMNRTIAYGGQLAAIGVEGLMSTFMPSDSPLSDFGNTLPGKILSGIAGAKPSSPIVAGNAKRPLENESIRNQQEDAAESAGGDTHVHMYNPKIQAKDYNDFTDKLNQQARLSGHASGGTGYAVPGRIR
ncbi:phage tail tape measure protein [[Mycobacterium] zoologicum]|uniref:phage tail tape measure protein n=1 Tax=[Mycobacterium] zoologicum TaxID=2872311 RepID=UPI001CDA74F1|nr:phage tail tape measure protein [Mycolicibacter sp. MYC101]MEB3062483.1 phage tail tape measure protein [Mycolicibacter sp. MYC101]